MDEYDDGPYWVILGMYGSHDMRHTGFRRLTVVNGTLGFWGVTQRTQNCVTSGRFPPTLVILRLGAM